MLKNINLNSPEWCELVFTGKNKEYGAYELRKTSSSRHLRALLVVVAGAVLIMALPVIIKSVVPQQAKEQVLEVTALSDLKMETKVPEENIVRNIEAPPPPKLKSSIKFTPPVIKADKEVNDNDEIKTQEELTTSKMAISVADVQGTDSEDAIDIADLKDNKEVIQEETKPYTAVEQGIQGIVTIRFVVSPDGEVTDIQILRKLDPTCDREAVRVIKSLPKWMPGKQNGKAVPVYFTLPVRFKLQ